MAIKVRPYTVDDFEALLEVQREAFPPPFPEELWWNREQIESHVRLFPEGAMAAVAEGRIVGSATALIVQFTGEPHTWEEVADDGYIRTHDPDGDSLYGIDVCVRPSWRGRGVGAALYEARKALVVKRGLKRFIAGCRIPDYHRVADSVPVEEYVRQVEARERQDLVLSFMLRQGMKPLQVLKGYVEDEESLNHGVLVEWRNPAFT